MEVPDQKLLFKDVDFFLSAGRSSEIAGARYIPQSMAAHTHTYSHTRRGNHYPAQLSTDVNDSDTPPSRNLHHLAYEASSDVTARDPENRHITDIVSNAACSI